MFGWRRKNEGFEWREYVRTTIKLRREDRARKIDEIKQAAAAGAMAAGKQGVSASRSGVSALWSGFVWLVKATVSFVTSSLRRGGAGITTALAGRGLPGSISARTKIAAMFGGLGVLAGLSAYLQYWESGAGWSAGLAGLVALILLGLAFAPWINRIAQRLAGWARGLSVSGMGMPSMPRIRFGLPTAAPSPNLIGAAVAVLVAGGGGLWAWQSGGLSAASSAVISALPDVTLATAPALKDISGRGRAISGDTIRIDGRTVQMAGIEAPEISQKCRDKRNRSWSCGVRSRNMLRSLIGNRNLVCSDVVRSDAGRLRATCRMGELDIAGEQVRKGYAFAQGTIFRTYADGESEARAAALGVWQGDVQRPADYPAQRWEIASKSAPDGCPIKGRVVRNSKIYVLPWAFDYRRVRIRRQRGERWFCSEAEAKNAGFRPSSTG